MVELPFPSPPLTEDVVLLRPWREKDVPAQLEAFTDPVFRPFSDWAPHSEVDARRQLVEQEAARQRGVQVQLALVEPHDHGLMLGGVSLNDVDQRQDRASVGYWLAPKARGRGVATMPSG